MSHVFQKLQTTAGSCWNRSVAVKGKNNKEIYRLEICNLMWGALESGKEHDSLVILYKDSARSLNQKSVFLSVSGI